jgi:hypothetical protein
VWSSPSEGVVGQAGDDGGDTPASHDQAGERPGDVVRARGVPSRVASALGAAWAVLALVALAAALRIHTAMASFETLDERTWMVRSDRFWHSIATGDFDAGSAVATDEVATMPGVTTMWLGTIARGVWALGNRLTWWDTPEPASAGGYADFIRTRVGLNLGQIAVAVATSLLIGLLVVLLQRWVGSIAAAVAGLLVATEPFIVAQGAVLHTDELTTLFGVTATLAALLVLGLPTPRPAAGNPWLALACGALLAGSILTKLSGLLFAPGIAALVVWAALRAHRAGDRTRPLARLVALAAIGLVITAVLLYPALWSDPAGEASLLVQSARLRDDPQPQLLFGREPGRLAPLFYPVVVPLRSTPWLLVGGIAAAAALLWRRATRPIVAALSLVAAPQVVVLSLTDKKFDRYGLVFMVLAAILIGAAAQSAWTRLAGPARRRMRWVAVAGAAVIVVNALVVSPYGLMYYNPLLGGSAAAERNVVVGWGEGTEQVGKIVHDLEGGDCDGVTVGGMPLFVATRRCGDEPVPGEPPDYCVVTVTQLQVFPELTANAIADREVVGGVRIRGIDAVRIYGPRPAHSAATGGC